jgi:ribosomal protein S10
MDGESDALQRAHRCAPSPRTHAHTRTGQRAPVSSGTRNSSVQRCRRAQADQSVWQERFERRFFREHVEIRNMREREVDALRDKMEVTFLASPRSV